MTCTSIDTKLELWASSLWDVKARMCVLFAQEDIAGMGNLSIASLLGEARSGAQGRGCCHRSRPILHERKFPQGAEYGTKR